MNYRDCYNLQCISEFVVRVPDLCLVSFHDFALLSTLIISRSQLVLPSHSIVGRRSNVIHSFFFFDLFRRIPFGFLFTLLLSRSDFLRPLEPLFLYKYP